MRFLLGLLFVLWASCVQAQFTPLPYTVVSTATETGHVFKGASGALFRFQVNTGGSAGWVLLVDGIVVPSNGAVVGCSGANSTGCVAAWWQVGSSTTLTVDYGQLPQRLFNGITVVFSTTGPFTMTSSATAVFAGTTQ